MNPDADRKAIDKALAYLRSQQQDDGGFVSYSSPNRQQFAPKYTYQTVFVPALILQSLAGCNMPTAQAIRTKLAAFLQAAKSPHGSYNYWAPKSPERETFPYPDDLDDTFCALIALWRHDKTMVDGALLAQMVKILVAAEEQPGGPYRTWLAQSKNTQVWRDVDVAVNANIAYFLQLIDSPLPSLAGFLEHAIIAGRLRSPYYPSQYPLLYYLSRAYQGTSSGLLTAELKALQRDGYWQTPLQTALAVCALSRLPVAPDISAARTYLLQRQQDDGSWPAEAFCTDPSREGHVCYQGAASLTTAFALEALILSGPPSERIKQKSDDRAERLHTAIVANVGDQFASLDKHLAKPAQKFASHLLERDKKREITLLPYYFAQSLKSDNPLIVQPLTYLGMASVYGWIAYSIYDDFLDDEGQIALLSVANVCLRYSLVCFQKAVSDSAFERHVLTTFNSIDAANTWEVTHCRFGVKDGAISVRERPDYGDRMRLAERSLGHTLGPAALLNVLGYAPSSKMSQQTDTMLRHYLIARQLNDDLHDWEDDFRAGRITFVVAYMLDQLNIQPGEYPIDELVVRLSQKFWNVSLPHLCDIVADHLDRARKAKPDMLKPAGPLDTLLDKIAQTMDRTRASQTDAKKFLQNYRATM